MDSFLLPVLVLFAVLSPVFSGKLPPNTKGCKRDDPNLNECVINTVNEIVPFVYDGCKECGIPRFEPFDLKRVILSEKNSKGEGLEFTLNNMKLEGFKNWRLGEGTKINLDERHIELKIPLPYAILDGNYNLDGKLLQLPVKGNGFSNFTFEDVIYIYNADLTINKEKDGKEYLHLENTKVSYTPKHFSLELTNLFNGDKKLGDQFNKFMNDNGAALLEEFDFVIRESIKKMFTLVLNSVAHTVPYDVLFPK